VHHYAWCKGKKKSPNRQAIRRISFENKENNGNNGKKPFQYVRQGYLSERFFNVCLNLFGYVIGIISLGIDN